MKKIIRLLQITIILIIIFTTISLANALNLSISTTNKNINVGNEFDIKVDWVENMQAVDFVLEYDVDKVEYISCDIENIYIKNNDGKIRISWVSLDNRDKTCVDFLFKAKKTGSISFNTKTDGGFATGELNIPNEYNEGKLELKIKDSKNIVIYHLIIFIILIILISTFIIKNKHQKKEKIK